MGFTIRLLQPTDHDEWLRLRIALWPHISILGQAEEMAVIQADFDQQPVFVVERASGVGLCGLMEVTIHAEAPGCETNRIGYLEAWYIDPDCRQLGLGRRLVEAAETWARAHGCTEMASDTCPDYPISPTAHQRLGYRIVRADDNGDVFFCKQL